MIITLYKNTSEHIVVDKSITKVREEEGNLRQETSLTDPVIVFERNIEDFTSEGVNYLYIPDFGNRYYYITGMRSIRSHLVEVSCHVDVLMTYRDKIRACSAIIERGSPLGSTITKNDPVNLYVPDGNMPALQKRVTVLKRLSGGVKFQAGGQHSYILVTAG